jgi:pyridoxamine 5'-phosphate oxidase
MSEWFETLPGLWTGLWDCLAEGVARRDAPARHVVLATVGLDGGPEARTVVLRGADADAGVIEFHTDLHSAKVAELRRDGRAAVVVWDGERRLQVRLSVSVTELQGDAAAAIWEQVPDPSRQSYGVVPAPGTPIAGALDYEKCADRATFAVLLCELRRVDLVHLGEVHRRAGFARADGWAGRWLVP